MTNKSDVFVHLMVNTTEVYLFSPVDNNIKVFFAAANVIAGTLSFHANSLILYFSYKKPRFVLRRSFSRVKLIDCYIQSLALIDVLCALISAPIFTTELFVDLIKTDMSCMIVRALTMYFPIATIFNYLTIGRERYLAVLQPFNVLSVSAGKKLVVAAWFLAAIINIVLRPSYKLVRSDIGEGEYTQTCKYDNSTSISRGLFLSFTTVSWVVPCGYLIITNFLTLKYLRQQQRAVAGIFPRVRRENVYRYKMTTMFIWLIFAFVTPYTLFIFYSGFAMVLKLNVSFTADYSTRYLIALLTYSNGVTSASILFYFSNYNRKKLKKLYHRVFGSS